MDMATDTTQKLSRITKTPDVCGGDACIRGTRITVSGLVHARRLGATDEELLANIVGLTADDIEAAWEYYRQHPAEIDEAIRLDEEP
jgi:uncharacterized protein (DUF433 family)